MLYSGVIISLLYFNVSGLERMHFINLYFCLFYQDCQEVPTKFEQTLSRNIPCIFVKFILMVSNFYYF